MKQKEDSTLHQNIKSSQEGFLKIYNLYWESLFKYVIRIVNDEDDAADIVQESFIVLWEMREDLTKVTSLKAYLFVIGRNKAFHFLKKNLRSETFRNQFIEEYGKIVHQFEQDIDRNYLENLIYSEVSKLPEKMRIIFLLSRKEYLSYKEIAEQLNISELTVKKQISNAIKQLRRKIDYSYVPVVFLLQNLTEFVEEIKSTID